MDLEAHLRRYASARVLAAMDWLPRFRGGPIRELQKIRHFQRRIAKKIFKRSRPPNDASIALDRISVMFFYELEDFETINARLKKIFKASPGILARLNEIVEKESQLDGLSWTNLGSISSSSKPAMLFGETARVKQMPGGIARLDVGHFRVLPSLSALHFSFDVPSALAQAVESESNAFRCPELVSNSLWPLRFMKGYSMSQTTNGREVIGRTVTNFCNQFVWWVENKLLLRAESFECRSTVASYKIQRQDKTRPFKEFCSEHKSWLEQYGYNVYGHDQNYASNRAMISCNKSILDVDRRETLFFEAPQSDETGMDAFALREDVKGVLLHSGALAQSADYRIKFEQMRVPALGYLRHARRKLPKLASFVGALRLSAQQARRMGVEMIQTEAWSFHVSGSLGNYIYSDITGDSNYAEDVRGRIKYNLGQLEESSKMIMPVLSEQMNADNIAVMHGLQSRAVWLTVASVVIAGVGLLSVWDKLKGIWSWLQVTATAYLA